MIHIAKGGLSWILAVFGFAFIFLGISYFTSKGLFFFSFTFSAFFFLVACLLVVFFRDPDRSIGKGIVAVADGKIREILRLQDPEVGDCMKISTFMNIHNVHVNRMPYAGSLEKMTHYSGRHLPAFQKESDANERVILLLKTDIGVIKIIQIAGAVARRIVPYITEGTALQKGEKIGLIRLGSRVDLYLPATRIKTLMIQVHGRIKAGEDTIAEIYD